MSSKESSLDATNSPLPAQPVKLGVSAEVYVLMVLCIGMLSSLILYLFIYARKLAQPLASSSTYKASTFTSLPPAVKMVEVHAAPQPTPPRPPAPPHPKGTLRRAEAIRYLLELAQVKWENVVVTQETWPSLKEEMPLGQVPVLEVDGVKIGQSLAIARFLAHEFGMCASNALQNARLDMIADLVAEAINSDGIKQWPLVLLGMMKVDDKTVFFKEKVRPQLDNYAGTFEKFLVENGSNALLCGDQVTWVDVFAAEFFSKFCDFGEKDCLEAFPTFRT
uniref:Uncharacterized protein n=1 Tax=Ditylenchus dipsaci TaxID=166011 RepID=A0A915D1M5_9BILA